MIIQNIFTMLFPMLVIACEVRLSISSVVVLVQGRIRGVAQDGLTIYNGIPYATVDKYGRFKEAGLAPSWSGVKDSHSSRCTEASDPNECLVLDIHVPTSINPPWPVYAWVAGGSGKYYPRDLVRKDIIVVTVYHRLGPQGFLCLGVEKAPGNAGVKDVVLALRWIRDNIVAFKGNPSRVVVGGQGFGAAMVEALMLSRMSRELFYGAILQSGTAFSPWAFYYDSENRSKTLLNMLSESENVMSLLDAKNSDVSHKSEILQFPYFPFGMCVEKPFKKEEMLLSESPHHLISKHQIMDVPTIIGYNSNEAYIFITNLIHNNILKVATEGITPLLPEELKLNERQRRHIGKQIDELYFRNNVTMVTLLHYYRDAYFLNHIYRSMVYHAQHHPVYFYEFSHSSPIGIEPEMGFSKSGAAHSDELVYLFSEKGRNFDHDDQIVKEHLIDMWSNFVKYSTPTHNASGSYWKAVDLNTPSVFIIDTEPSTKEFSQTNAMQIWNDIYTKYYFNANEN